jgi:hypothetical protein
VISLPGTTSGSRCTKIDLIFVFERSCIVKNDLLHEEIGVILENVTSLPGTTSGSRCTKMDLRFATSRSDIVKNDLLHEEIGVILDKVTSLPGTTSGSRCTKMDLKFVTSRSDIVINHMRYIEVDQNWKEKSQVLIFCFSQGPLVPLDGPFASLSANKNAQQVFGRRCHGPLVTLHDS